MDNPGISTQICRLLSRHRKPLPIGYLADRLGRRRSEMEREVNGLVDAGLVRRDGDLVSLTPTDQTPTTSN